MGQVIELEGATEAIDPGSLVELQAEESTLIAEPGVPRKVLYIYNDTNEILFLRFAEDGCDSEQSLVIGKAEGFIVREYHGPVCVWSAEGGEIRLAVF